MARKTTRKAGSADDLARLNSEARVVILHGPDEMIRREHLRALRTALAAEHGEIEPSMFDGKTADLAGVLDELRTQGMFQSFKLVVVDEADAFVSRHREALERYAKAPVASATLVLRSTTWRPGNFDKLVDKVGVKIKCEALDAAGATAWLLERAKTEHACKLDKAAASLLVERLGTDLMQLDTELGKLSAAAGKGGKVDAELINQIVGRSSDEQVWVLQQVMLEAMTVAESGGGEHGGRGGRGGAATATAGGRVIEKIHEVVDLSRQPEVLVIWAMVDLARKLFQGAMLRQQGEAPGSIMRQVKAFGPMQRPFMNVLQRLGPEAAQRWFDRAIEMDRRSKSGLGSAMENLECFCATLADDLK